MKLKEFSLWGFKLELEDSRKFTLFNRCVCAHFERHFQPIETDGIYRVVIKLSEHDDRTGTTELSSSVLKYYRYFNFVVFNDLDEVSQKKILLDMLYESLIDLCDLYNWPKDNFKLAYEGVVNDRFLNSYSLKKKVSKNKKLNAELVCNHGSSSFDCFVKVTDGFGREVFVKHLFSEEPDEFLFNGRIGDLKWLSNQTLVYRNRDKAEAERFEFGDGL
jgi:hypothetical protein